jgi:16S rRNA (uracil1498-N3)-methyltransferase
MQRLAIAPTQERDGQITLTPKQQHYLTNVLRLKNGDRFVAMNGRGTSWLVELTGTSARILESIPVKTELPVAVTLMAALPKGQGFDEVVRCCVELGVTTIVPVISDRTLLAPSPQKLERWRRIATEAAEQSERQIVPILEDPAPFTKAIASIAESNASAYICAARKDAPHLLYCLQQQQPKHIVIATGPEGGWTEPEVEKAIANGFQAVSLGRRILRAITAPVTALSLIAATTEVELTIEERQSRSNYA